MHPYTKSYQELRAKLFQLRTEHPEFNIDARITLKTELREDHADHRGAFVQAPYVPTGDPAFVTHPRHTEPCHTEVTCPGCDQVVEIRADIPVSCPSCGTELSADAG